MTQPIIQLSGLDKFYGNFQALSQVDLDIKTGEFFSLLRRLHLAPGKQTG